MGNDRSRLTTDLARTLRRDWTARELGNTQGLVSGTATLMRRIE